jgi:glycosyltransferase involved in cell wall biosynthesis
MPEAIALRCKWLLENERERRRISLMAWSYVRGTHTWQHTADRFLAAIEEGMRYG